MALQHLGRVDWEKLEASYDRNSGLKLFGINFAVGVLEQIKRLRSKAHDYVCEVVNLIVTKEDGTEHRASGSKMFLYKDNLYVFPPSDPHSEEKRILLIEQYHLKIQAMFNKIKKEIELFKKA